VPQTHKVIENLIAILAKAGCTLEDVVKANVWLDDARDFHAFNRVYSQLFRQGPAGPRLRPVADDDRLQGRDRGASPWFPQA
jgi:enamine deaminase RidA (YjgF/YER057c/UK114 family)